MTTSRIACVVFALSAIAMAVFARGSLELTMQRHMLLQLPMLFAAGMLLAFAARSPGGVRGYPRGWNVQGMAGLLLVSGVLASWMVPRALDAAVEWLAVDLLKVLSLAVAGSMAVYSWRDASIMVRTFFIGNLAWMTATIGMVLLDAPVRLCTNYGTSDQRETGIAMIALTVAGGFAGVVYALRGHRDERRSTSDDTEASIG